MKKELLILVIGVLLIGIVSAELIFEQNSIIDLKLPCILEGVPCSNSAECNISIKYPNSDYLIDLAIMTNKGNGDFNITLNETKTATLGEHRWDVYCCDGEECGDGHGSYEITVNGKDKPSGIVIVLFSILFLILLAALISLILYTLGHLIEKDFDMKDLIYNLSAYFVLFGVYILGKEYVGNSFINNFLEWMIAICAFTNVIFPIVTFILSITIWKMQEMQEEM